MQDAKCKNEGLGISAPQEAAPDAPYRRIGTQLRAVGDAGPYGVTPEP